MLIHSNFLECIYSIGFDVQQRDEFSMENFVASLDMVLANQTVERSPFYLALS